MKYFVHLFVSCEEKNAQSNTLFSRVLKIYCDCVLIIESFVSMKWQEMCGDFN